jgi:hypothetical protein
MSIIECDVPSSDGLSRDLIDHAYFRDSYRVLLDRPDLDITQVFFAIFGHKPIWVKLLLIARNAAARLGGLDVPIVGEILNPVLRDHYAIGEKIGPWPIFFIDGDEIVAGRNNRHLDFRVSVLKTRDGETVSVVVSTICTVHNAFGKIYLFVIAPFHRNGVKLLMANAVAAKRL